MVARAPITADTIEGWIIGRLVDEYAVDRNAVASDEPFESLGLASRELVTLSGDLEAWLGLSLSPVLLYEYPTIRALAEYLAAIKGAAGEQVTGSGAELAAALAGQLASSAEDTPGAQRPADLREPIAIIGMAGRFPGADNLDAFWQALLDGKDCIGPVPAGRWDADQVARLRAGKKPLPPWGGFLEGPEEFDAAFFAISGREAAHIDPQQRLLLELTWEAVADAGLRTNDLAGQPVGVYVGISSSDYGQAQMGRLDQINSYFGTGSANSIAANRLSYYFDWRGPSVAVDTACSSSLVAVHLACRSLRSGETRVAVVAGVNLIFSPAVTVNFNEAGAMAADGRCKAFDARADGYVRSEGAGVVVLKPLSQALADGDRVYAVILGSAVNQDGRTNGLMAPNPRSQEEVLLAACRDAGVSPAELAYVEAHGSGTLLGDSIEAKALAAVRFGAGGKLPLRIGSVKTNIGHLEAAAGVAGLVKVALAIHNRQLPPSLHFETPNPHIAFDELPLRVQTRLEAWPQPGERALAGVSSFGFGGTNAHVVLVSPAEIRPAGMAAALAERTPSRRPEPVQEPDGAGDESPQVLLLSARTPEALAQTARRWREWLGNALDFEAVRYTAARRRTHLEQRLALVAGSAAEARELLDKYLAGEADPRLEAGAVAAGHPEKLVFVCPGQGSQWLGMARDLFGRQPAFRRSLEETGAAFRAFTDWDLVPLLLAEELPDQIDVIQPMLFAISVALAALWRAMGVVPAAVVGHSLGEVAAAHIAGVLSLEDASRVICGRSRLLRQISGNGLMVMAELTEAEAEAWVAGQSGQVAVAAVNGPRSVVLSGEPAAVEALLVDMEARGVFCRRVKVDVASHSPQVDELRQPLLALLAPIHPQAARVPVYSTVTGTPLAGPEMDAAYWADNLRQPVRFASAVARLQADAFNTFVELSPHPVLLPAIGQMPSPSDQSAVLVQSMRREADGWSTFMASLGRLHAHGYPVDWSGLYPHPRPLVSLPAYPWQRERHWFQPEGGWAPAGASTGDHPLLGGYLTLATDEGTHLWQTRLSLQALPFLGDHRIEGQVLFPAAGYLEMALAAGTRYAGGQRFSLAGIQFDEALSLLAGAAVTAQLVISAEEPGQAAFQVATMADGQPWWTRHAQGFIRLGQPEVAGEAAFWPSTPAQMQARLGPPVPAEVFYAELAGRGLHYGPAFQRVAEVWRGEGEALARLSLPDEADLYRLHPALLDGAFQTLALTLSDGASRAMAGRLFLPVSLEALRLGDRPLPAAPLWCYARLAEGPLGDPYAPATAQGDLFIYDATGNLVAAAQGLRLRAVGPAAVPAEALALSRWFYHRAWEPAPLDQPAAEPRSERWLLFVQPGNGQPELAEHFAGGGRRCVLVYPGPSFARLSADRYQLAAGVPSHFRQLMGMLDADGQAPAGVVYGWGAVAKPDELAVMATQSTVGVLHLAQALLAAGWRQAPRLYLLARDLVGAPLSGLAHTLNHEHPEFRCTVIELPVALEAADAQAVVRECLAGTPETQVSLAGGQRQVARLLALNPTAALAEPNARALPAGQPFRLQVRQIGLLDSLYLTPMERRPPAAGEVEIAIEAAGLNFLDVLSALGNRPDQQTGASNLGVECAGRVTAVGAGVTGLQVGDEVVALAPGAFASFATTRAELVARKPAALEWDAAATVPIAFLTAYYALRVVGRLQPGERVLIHSAASGTGLAAVQVAQWLQADIIATAGSAARRAYLRSLGVRHVLDSRTLAFAGEIMTLTEGAGVDVVLNALAGEAIPTSLSLLRSRGRFLELGKRDIYAHRKVGLYALRRNLSIAVVDLAGLATEEPLMVGQLLSELLSLVDQGALRPLPYESFPLGQAAFAFRRMAQAQHHGKIVLKPAAGERAVSAIGGHVAQWPAAIRPDGAYLITGGLGAIGRQVATYLVEQGARQLLLVGRTAPSAEALADIAVWQAGGATVHVVLADVACEPDMHGLFGQFKPQPDTEGETVAPLRGIFHAAGVLDDGLLLHQTAERFEAVMAPKVAGSWNLHRLSLAHPVELFVLFSSAAALVGSPGQANYAAGNAFMDGLARWRQAQGLPALSIQWGPWTEIGLAARVDRAGRLRQRGFDAIRPEQGLRALEWALAEAEPVVAVMPFDVRQWRQSYPQAAGWPLLSALEMNGPLGTQPASRGLRDALLAAGSTQERQALLEKHLSREMAEVLRISTSRIGPATALDGLGFDSLLALELRNRLELSLGVRLSATLIWNYPTVRALVDYLASIVAGVSEAAEPDHGPLNRALAEAESATTLEADRAILTQVAGLTDEAALRELLGDDE